MSDPASRQRTLTRTQLRIIRDRSARLLHEYRTTDPWALAEDLRDALFLLDEKPTPEQRELLRDYGGA